VIGRLRRAADAVLTCLGCLFLCLVAGVVVSAALSGVLGGGCSAGPDPDSQKLYQVQLKADRAALLSGYLRYPLLSHLTVGRDTTFTVTLTGLTNGTATPVPSQGGQPVRIGGLIGVRMICQGADCLPLSSEKQNVITSADRATWTWSLTARHTGTARLTLVVTTYQRDTGTALEETPPIRMSVPVEATPSYVFGRAVTWVKAVVGLVGVTVIGGAVIAGWRRLRARAAKRTPDDTGDGRTGYL
jgi:hypothetical protein